MKLNQAINKTISMHTTFRDAHCQLQWDQTAKSPKNRGTDVDDFSAPPRLPHSLAAWVQMLQLSAYSYSTYSYLFTLKESWNALKAYFEVRLRQAQWLWWFLNGRVEQSLRSTLNHRVWPRLDYDCHSCRVTLRGSLRASASASTSSASGHRWESSSHRWAGGHATCAFGPRYSKVFQSPRCSKVIHQPRKLSQPNRNKQT